MIETNRYLNFEINLWVERIFISQLETEYSNLIYDEMSLSNARKKWIYHPRKIVINLLIYTFGSRLFTHEICLTPANR
jgi:hypothetical protein